MWVGGVMVSGPQWKQPQHLGGLGYSGLTTINIHIDRSINQSINQSLILDAPISRRQAQVQFPALTKCMFFFISTQRPAFY